MPTSAPGSSGRPGNSGPPAHDGRRADAPAARRAATRGFTLVELLVVLLVIALGAGVVSLALRDGRESRLDHEGERLATLLEAARAEARALGLPVLWMPLQDAEGAHFRFLGLPASAGLPTRWLDDEVSATVIGATAVSLGPDALIGAQRIVLSLGDRRLELATDGLGPFAVADPS
jgi:general secretion pathway protein H